VLDLAVDVFEPLWQNEDGNVLGCDNTRVVGDGTVAIASGLFPVGFFGAIVKSRYHHTEKA